MGDGYRCMRLHFADNSDERGQYAMLIEEGCVATLASYHYLKSNTASREFTKLWEEQVKLHLVAWPSQEPQKRALVDESQPNHLMSYADKGNEGAYGEVWENQVKLHLTATDGSTAPSEALVSAGHEKHLMSYHYRSTENTTFKGAWRDLRPRVLIDSGAFSAWISGKPIRPEDYGEWALKFDMRWREKMASLHFINLDVIGDQIGTWKNQEILERMGMDPVPVITQGADRKHLEHALERYDYICLGGLVPLATQKKQMRGWLDRCFKTIMQYAEKQGRLTRVHLLGVTQAWVLNRYPCYSTDSSAWTKPLRFGHGDRAGLRVRLPKYKDGSSQMAATLHALRAEIRYFKKMEEDATRLWAKRGIVFDSETEGSEK